MGGMIFSGPLLRCRLRPGCIALAQNRHAQDGARRGPTWVARAMRLFRWTAGVGHFFAAAKVPAFAPAGIDALSPASVGFVLLVQYHGHGSGSPQWDVVTQPPAYSGRTSVGTEDSPRAGIGNGALRAPHSHRALTDIRAVGLHMGRKPDRISALASHRQRWTCWPCPAAHIIAWRREHGQGADRQIALSDGPVGALREVCRLRSCPAFRLGARAARDGVSADRPTALCRKRQAADCRHTGLSRRRERGSGMIEVGGHGVGCKHRERR